MSKIKNTMLKNLVESTTNHLSKKNLVINPKVFKDLLQVVNNKKYTSLAYNFKNRFNKSKWRGQIDSFNKAISVGTEDNRFYYFDPKYGQGTYNTYKIKYARNNIFCHLFNNHGHTVHPVKSFGSYKIKISKKDKHKHIKKLMQLYSDEIINNKVTNTKHTITPVMVFNFESTKRIRKKIFRWIRGMVIRKAFKRRLFRRKQYKKLKQHKKLKQYKKFQKKKQDLDFMCAFKLGPLKAFNGCRGRIIRRKKRKYRFFKKKFIR